MLTISVLTIAEAVIAEAVETAEQAVFLSEKGCWHARGFLYGKPWSVQDAEALLVKTRR